MNHGWTHANDIDPIPGGGGHYVFLEEVTPVSDELVFSDIPQAYRHLVVELLVGVDTGSGVNLNIIWNDSESPQDFGAASIRTHITDTIQAYQDAVDHVEIEAGIGIIHDDDEVTANKTAFTMKFPYYCVADEERKVFWQAIGYDGATEATWYETGGGALGGVDDPTTAKLPITSLRFYAGGVTTLTAGSRASLYGIR